VTGGILQNITTSTKLHAMTPHTPCYHVNLYSNLTHFKFIFYVTERGTSLLNDLLKVARWKGKSYPYWTPHLVYSYRTATEFLQSMNPLQHK